MAKQHHQFDSATAPRRRDVQHRVLVLAPFGRDAAAVSQLLSANGFEPKCCADVEVLCTEMRDGASAALVAEEALVGNSRRRITAALTDEPDWSDFPLLLLLSQSHQDRDGWQVVRGIEGTAHLTLLERPLRTATLVSAVRAAVESRQRQYQIRDELAARAKAEAALRQSEEHFRLMANHLPLIVWIHDADGRQRFVNQTFHEYFGIGPDELQCDDWKSLMHPEDHEAYVAEFEASARERRPFHMEVRARRGDGQWRWLESWGRPRLGDNGEFLGFVGTSADVTDRKRIDEALRDWNEELERRVAERTEVAEQRARDLRRLAGELSEAEHRERTRLAKLLHDELQQLLVGARLWLPDLVDKPLEVRREHVQRIDELLQNCLSTSRNLSQELSPPILQRGTLSEVVDWLGDWFQETQGLVVEVAASDMLPEIPEDVRVFLFHALRELLFNVVKHSGTMAARVALMCEENDLFAEVEDEGVGIDADVVAASLRQPQGFGLFNIRERLEALGGRLEIQQRPEGGARFRMVVPLAGEPQSQAGDSVTLAGETIPSGSGDSGKHRSVINLLVVDDQQVVREGIVGLLNRQPDFAVVGEAADGLQAVEQAEALRPDAIVMDVNMPHVDGIEATRRIKKRQPEILIVGLSLHDEESIIREMTLAGADDYVPKHAPAKDLVESIRRLWRRASA